MSTRTWRVPQSEIASGWERPDGRTVVLLDEDLAALPLPTKRTVDVLGFVDERDVDPVLYSRPYWVGALLWPEEIREPDDLSLAAPVTERELELAELLMDQLAGVNIGELHDDHAAALEQLVVAKMTGAGLQEPKDRVPTVDLMAALDESIRQAGKR